MIKDAIRYTIIILVVIGIVLVMKNLVNSDDKFTSNRNKKNNKSEEVMLYSAKIGLYEDDTDKILSGANLVVKDSNGQEITNFTTGNDLYVVSNLKVGTYTLEEIKAPTDYKLNEDKVIFTIKNKDVNVKMYNKMMSDEEIDNSRKENTDSSEVGVDNTSSMSNKLISLLSVILFMSGIVVISRIFVKNKYYG